MPKMRTSDGNTLYYRDMGTGPCIVMLHGFGMHSGHWLPFAWLLSRTHRVIAPDLRGFGRSHYATFNNSCAVTNFANDVNELITELSLESFKLVGISMGALTALKLIELHKPKSLEHYLHIDQSPCCVNKEDWKWGLFGDEQSERFERARYLLEDLRPYIRRAATFDELPQMLRKQVHHELSDFFASALSKPAHKKLSRRFISKEWVSKAILPVGNWSAYMHCLNAYLEHAYDLRSAVASSHVPIDVAVGVRSDMYPAAGQLRMADMHPECRIIAFNKSGHAPLIDQPIKFAKELKRFADDSRT